MNGEIGRRRALQVAALGAAAAVGGGWGTWTSLLAPSGRDFRPSSERSLWEPPVLASAGGILEVDLTAGVGVTLAGRRTRALGYNGTSPGPTLRVAPGDVLRVMLANDLEETTNLHTHGLHVSPRGRGDDPFRMVEPGQRAGYEYAVPRDHPTGTFWYHPHHHGAVAGQLFGGLFGAVVVAAADEPASPAERVLVISDITLTGDGEVAGVGLPAVMMGREGDLVLVNGQLRPRLEATEGAQERWRVVNACTSRFLELELDDHSLGLAGYDGQALGAPQDRATVALAPGNRADLFVRLPDAGTFTLRTRGHDRGGMGMMGMMGDGASGTSTAAVLATVRVAARPTSAADPPALPQPRRRIARDHRPPRRDDRSPAHDHGDDGDGDGLGHGGRRRHDLRLRRPGRSTPAGSTSGWPSARSRNGPWSTPHPWTTPSTCTCGRCRSWTDPGSTRAGVRNGATW